jgi:hypothetical protein
VTEERLVDGKIDGKVCGDLLEGGKLVLEVERWIGGD